MEILTNKFYRDFVREKDQKFFNFVFSKNQSQYRLMIYVKKEVKS